MIGVLGLGGAGGNIAEVAQRNGMQSAAINFSQKDLDAIDVKYKLRLTGSEGVGKNRNEAIELFQQQWELATRFIQDNLSNIDLLVFAFSSSGGSGSGIAPMLIDIISNVMPDKVLSAFVIIPDSSEATVSQANCLSTFQELSKLPISIFPIDNQRARQIYYAKNKLFEVTNSKAIELLNKISSYTEKTSKNGNFDKQDFLTVMKTRGIATMSEVDLSTLNQNIQLSSKWVSDKVIESWHNNVFVSVDNEKVSRAAMIFDGQEGLMDYLSHEECFRHFTNGIPIDLFEGYYHESKGKLFSILTGLSWCSKRLHDIEISIERDKDKIESMFIEQDIYQSNGVAVLDRIRKQPTDKKQSVSDILSKYKK